MTINERLKLLVVDDEEMNIDVINGALKIDYKILAAKNGKKALDICSKIRPDVILLDIMMPEMSGFDVIKKLKASEELKDIPVIFMTAVTDIEKKKEGFLLGAVDYVTKPIEIEELKARVAAHIKIEKSRQEIKGLLTETLYGSIKLLMEVFSTANPVAYMKSNRIKDLVKRIMTELNMGESWEFKLASSLSHIGCYSMSPEILEKIFNGEEVSYEEQQFFLHHPEIGANILSKIPRLEGIAEIIENQLEPLGNIELDKENAVHLGIQILNAAIRYDMGVSKGLSSSLVIENMRESGWYNEEVLDVLDGFRDVKQRHLYQEISIFELEKGMIIGEDISLNGKVIVKKGMPVNELIGEHLSLLNKIGEIEDKIRIMII